MGCCRMEVWVCCRERVLPLHLSEHGRSCGGEHSCREPQAELCRVNLRDSSGLAYLECGR